MNLHVSLTRDPGRSCPFQVLSITVPLSIFGQTLLKHVTVISKLVYILKSTSFSGAIGFAVHIVSGARPPSYLDARIEEFLSDFAARLRKMEEEEFEQHRCVILYNVVYL